MSRLLALKALVHDAIDATTRIVGEGHASAGRSAVRVGDRLPGLGDSVRAVDGVRGVVTEGVLASVRGVNRLVEALSDKALSAVPWPGAAPARLPLHEDALFSPTGAVDQLVGLLNGAVGDHLRRRANALDLGMTLRVEGAATDTLVVAVHGLGTTELSWVLDATRELGDGAASLPGRLAAAIGATPVYARYNTGVHVADNGAALARAVEAAVDGWPVPVRRIVLVGHSMGGLVSRAARAAAMRDGLGWAALVSHVVTVSTPHSGAPLALVGHTAAAVLNAVDLPASRVLGLLVDGRSDGIKDLVDGAPNATGPLDAGVTWVFVAGTLHPDPTHVTGHVLGDLLVTVRSAHGPTAPDDVRRHTVKVGGVVHHAIQTDARVVDAVLAAVTAP